MDPKLDDALQELYYNIDNSSAFSGVENLYKAVKSKGLPYSKKQIKEWLRWQKTYTLHFPLKKKWKRAKIISYGPMWMVEADLGVITDLKFLASNYQYILLVVCTFTKKLFARALKSKKSTEVASSMDNIFTEANPNITYFRTGTTEKLHMHIKLNYRSDSKTLLYKI